MMLDEYDFGADLEKWPGAKSAVDEFCDIHNVVVKKHFTGRNYLEKSD